jgi:hypothetical protein
MTWLILTQGAPDEPGLWKADQLASYPTPQHFFQALFMDCCGMDVRSGEVMEETTDTRTTRGYRGDETMGYRWVEEASLETSSLPRYVEAQTYGVPGLTIHWSFSWAYVGQAGHAAFRHHALKARFEHDEARTRFETVWRQLFKKDPVFQPAATPPPDLNDGRRPDTLPTTTPMKTFFVRVIDNFHRTDPDEQFDIDGFPTLEAAHEYAMRRVRSSVENLRKPGQSKGDLYRAWKTFGEEVVVEGGAYIGLAHFDAFWRNPATDEEQDYLALDPRRRSS